MAPVTEKADPRIHDSRRDRFGPTRAPGWLRRAAAAAATAVVLAVLLPGATPQLAELEALLAAAARFEAVGRVREARARVLAVQAMHPAHPAPSVALQRLDTAHCPLPPGSSLAASDNLPECTWRFAVSTAASEQCRLSTTEACDPDARMGIAGGDSGSDQPAKGSSTVHVVEVQQGECGVLLEGEHRRQLARESALQQGSGSTAVFGVSFKHDDPETLREITDMDDIDVVALEGCEKGARASTRWHSVRLRLAPAMLDEGLLTWVEGTDPYLTARLFAKYENLDSSVIYPVYKLVVARNNAVRGRGNQGSPPPWTIPAALEAEFTMGSAVRVTQHYVDESDAESRDHYSFGFYRASHAEIEGLVDKASRRESHYYGDTDQYLYAALDQGRQHGGWGLQEKDVVIVGSLEPWYEAVCLSQGAASCTTLEYNKLDFQHPGLRTMTMAEYAAMEPKPKFDVALSISSLEHDGLGRYGDPVDANGDLKAMEKMRDIVRPGGFLLLAVPVGADLIKWNAHRKYGRARLPVLLHHWSLVAQVAPARGDEGGR